MASHEVIISAADRPIKVTRVSTITITRENSLKSSTISIVEMATTTASTVTFDDLMKELKAKGGKHLVLVRYTSRHEVNWEWIYNEADIEKAPVVWASDMGEEANRGLMEHFRSRQIWRFNADDFHWKLSPLTPSK
mgnify:CR=1 FL=1